MAAEIDAAALHADELHEDALVWDAHSCLPLHPEADFGALARHRRAGVSFVSVNIGMDMNPLPQVMTTLASFRAQIRARPDLFVLAGDTRDVLRAKAEGKLAVAFDLEGGLPLAGRPDMVQLFHDLGVRQIHLAYNRNNALGGGCYDDDVPLTPFGREIVRAINQAGMLMDISHTGHRTSLEIAEVSEAPVFFSHANPRALNGDPRNATDAQIRAVVQRGGVVCVNGVGRFLTDPGAGTAAIVEAIDHLVERIGPEQVGIGLDYEYAEDLDDWPPGADRAYWWPPAFGYGPEGARVEIARPEQIPEITEGLVRLGYAEGAIRRILGLNMLDLARRVWQPTAG